MKKTFRPYFPDRAPEPHEGAKKCLGLSTVVVVLLSYLKIRWRRAATHLTQSYAQFSGLLFYDTVYSGRRVPMY